MYSNSELAFCQRFPFSAKSKEVLKHHSFDLNKAPETVLNRAALMISAAAKGKPFVQEFLGHSSVLVAEIQAFPLAKILVSAMNRPELLEKFCELVCNNTFFYLSNDPNRRQLLLDLASDLEVSFQLSEETESLVTIPVLEFLKADFRQDFMKLVNQRVQKGRVFLSENEFARFLSEISREKTRQSLPVNLKNVPRPLIDAALNLKDQLAERQVREFSFQIANSAVEPNAFPPCMAKIFADLGAGKNVNHSGRFNIATFLAATGMQAEQIIRLYAKTPNFDEKVTRYHVERIIGKGKPKYSPSSCAKLADLDLRQFDCPCNSGEKTGHPISFYRRSLKTVLPAPEKTELPAS